jgi:uncharacterized surface protein with fasciclin (FAS1) repeats
MADPALAALAGQADVVKALLQYHVVGANLPSTAFTATPAFAPTLLTNSSYTNVTGGQVVEGVAMDGGVTIISGNRAESKVVTADVKFDGGVVHVIDTVLTIPSSIAETAAANNLTQLISALQATSLVDTVTGLKDITVFAPTNEAFEAVSEAVAGLSTEQVSSVLTYHVVPSVAYSSGLKSGEVPTVNGASVKVEVSDGGVKVNDANVVVADVLVANGVVHVIDKVLMPPAAESSGAASSSAAAPTTTAAGGAAGTAAASGTPATFTGAASLPTAAIGMGALLGAGAFALAL